MNKIAALGFALLTSLYASHSLAGTATTHKNHALGFTMIATPTDDIVSFCDYHDNCLDFKPMNEVGNKTLYKEVTNKCEISIEYFSKNFAEGKTKNDFMLGLSVQVVQVIKDETHCQLEQKLPKQKRSLTGFYF